MNLLTTARTREEIRRTLLARLEARPVAEGRTPPDVRRGSDDWMRMGALATMLELLERQAVASPQQILPDHAQSGHLDAQGAAADVSRAGLDEEDSAYQERQLVALQEILEAGSPDDWIAWLAAFRGIPSAVFFAFPQLKPGTTTGTAYAVTLVGLHPPSDPSAAGITALSGGELTLARAWIEGTVDVLGNAATGRQLRPVACKRGGWEIEAAVLATQDVAIEVLPDGMHPFPWHGSATIAAAATTWVEVNGDWSALKGLPILVNVGALVRGHYRRALVTTAVYVFPKTTLTFAAAVEAAPTGTVYPCPPTWERQREEAFAVFDALGPGDTATPRRWPLERQSRRAVLYSAQLERAAHAAGGILEATVLDPVPDITPAPKAVVVLGVLLVTEA